jgi:hypothetical protein
MSNALKKVHAGEQLRIPASTCNRLMDAARDHQADKQNVRHAALDGWARPLVYWDS